MLAWFHIRLSSSQGVITPCSSGQPPQGRSEAPDFDPPTRDGITQCLAYEARNLATVAKTNIWKHFTPRVLAHTRQAHRLSSEDYSALTRDQKRQLKLEIKQMAADLRLPIYGEP